MSPRPSKHLLLPLAALTLAAALAAPASSPAAEEATTPSTTEATPAPSEPPATSTPSAPSPAPPSPPATSSVPPGETAPAPTPPPPPLASTPQVSGQSAQGSTAAGHRRGQAGGPGNAGATSGGQHARGNGGGSSKPDRGARAPKPSALTPPLPLSLSSAIAGVPAFFIESFRIPPFLLPIYQAAGTAYGVPWQVLAAINEVETDYGRDLSVSSAGAEGWMQFLPSSWATYGVDANGDGFADPYNPADAIFAAARYLRAAGAATNLRGAIFSYNHSQAYVESVTLRAKLLGGTPSGLLGAITGLTESRFPVHARAHFTDGFPTVSTSGSPATRAIAGTAIYSEADAPVIAVQDGEIVRIGESPELGRFVSLRDAYGNTYTYAKLGSVAKLYPVLQPHDPVIAHARHGAAGAPSEPRPTGPASAGTQAHAPPSPEEGIGVSALSLSTPGQPGSTVAGAVPGSAAQPASPPPTAAPSAPSSLAAAGPTGSQTPRVFRDGPNDVHLHDLRAGVQVIAGTVLGHVAASGPGGEPSMVFQIRPAGTRAPLIDPKPILDGWVQLENSSVFRAKGKSPFATGAPPSAGQVLLESKEQLERQVLANPDIEIYPCGRQDIETDQIDRRVLATLEFLAVSGLKPTVSALKCGHSLETAEGNVSEHATGNAVDISAIDGVPIAGHQGPGTITDTTIRKLLTLQGSMKPHQIISLMSYPGADNAIAKADHFDHIHVGFLPAGAVSASLAGSLSSSITPSQWIKLIARLGEIPDPSVASARSAAAIPAPTARTAGGEG
jgi:murein DD-endopeptidase MepM/ murein hydrolase activator NlpD